MAGINVKLPMTQDDSDGVALNKDLRASTRQNLILLIMTVPGERPMDIEFGVGLPQFIFELDNAIVRGTITSSILQQVSIYMPFIEIISIDYKGEEAGFDRNTNSISISYNIVPLNAIGQINISQKFDPIEDRTFFMVEPQDIDLS